jgi:hypothetical protein
VLKISEKLLKLLEKPFKNKKPPVLAGQEAIMK